MSAPEEKLLFKPNSFGAVSVCLAYPGPREVALANLGFQAVFRILATTPGVVCERAYQPEPGHALLSYESRRSAGDFDIVAFSLSFESDYPLVVAMLDSAGIPARREVRESSDRAWPLLLAGGPACFLNPEPMAPFFDLFLLGEAEEMLVEAFRSAQSWRGIGGAAVLDALASVAGAYRPSDCDPVYGTDGRLADRGTREGRAGTVLRRYVKNLDDAGARTVVVAPDTVFGDKFLVEASRGCEWGCRFCAAGFMYRPVRHRDSGRVLADAKAGLEHSRDLGLVGAEMASHPGITRTCSDIADLGARVSPSSLKADVITPALAAALARAGTRSVTVAPEAGSERMRRVINKNLDEGEILRAAEMLAADGVESLKLYFMVGLPGEEEEDRQAIVDLVATIRDRLLSAGRERGRVGTVKVSINPFVPKPWTPFQWDAMMPVPQLKDVLRRLRRSLGRLANVQVDADSPREAYLQTLLSRGDRRVADIIETLARADKGQWWGILREMSREARSGNDAGSNDWVINPDDYVTREYEAGELLPWDFIDQGIERDYLWLERRRAQTAIETEPCDVTSCVTCGAC